MVTLDHLGESFVLAFIFDALRTMHILSLEVLGGFPFFFLIFPTASMILSLVISSCCLYVLVSFCVFVFLGYFFFIFRLFLFLVDLVLR